MDRVDILFCSETKRRVFRQNLARRPLRGDPLLATSTPTTPTTPSVADVQLPTVIVVLY